MRACKPRRHPKKEQRHAERVAEAEREALRGAFDQVTSPACDRGSGASVASGSGQVTDVEQAALEWWRELRPVGWTEAEHLKHPTVNVCGTERGRRLALAVAHMVSETKQGA